MESRAQTRWRGRWIWDHTDGTEKNAYVLFRRDFEVRTPAESVELRITAMSRYRVWVNGALIGEGPPKSQPFLTYYDTYPLQLEKGDNVICVLVNHVGYDDDSRGGLLAEILAGDDPVVVSDESWRVERSDAWRADTYFFRMNRVVPYQEQFSALRFDPRWLEPRFDDSGWRWANVVATRGNTQPPAAGPWSRIIPRDIPHMDLVPRRATSIEKMGANTAVMNRMRNGDLSILLSQPLSEMAGAEVHGAEHLLTESGETSFACSTAHRTDARRGVTEPGLVLDFERVINAYVEVDIEGPPGSRIEIGYAERLLDGEFSNVIEGQFADSVELGQSRIVWRAFGWKAFRYLRIRIREAFSPVVVHDLRAIETCYPFEEHGAFTTGDTELEAVFNICRYTTRLACNEYITDTPWREQGQWLGDVSAVTLASIYACFGDTRLARKFLVQSGATQYPTGFLGSMTNTYTSRWQWVLPDYSLWWLMAVRDYYRYTGETDIVHELYGVAVRLTETLLSYRSESGLIEDMPYWVFIDWADVPRTGLSAALNAIAAGALGAIEELASVRGDSYMADRAREAREAIAAAFGTTFWDAEEQLFVDAVDSNSGETRFSEHSNAAAILFGIASDEQTTAIVERIWAPGDSFLAGTNNGVTEAAPYFTTVVLRALAAADRRDLAVRIIRDRWGDRMVAEGYTSTAEEWSVHGTWRSGEFQPIMRTLSHAWSAAPAHWLITNLAGIEILEPGCTRVRVRPYEADFAWKATFPIPAGAISVRWDESKASIDVPKGVTLVTE